MDQIHLLITSLILVWTIGQVKGHGRLYEPPARSTMWRRGFTGVPIYSNDHELFCGGFTYQQNAGGKCGVCGDPWGGTLKHEPGGVYYTNKIARQYTQGQKINITVQLTAHHKGFFEFRLCAPPDEYHVDHDCLNKNLLQMENGETKSKSKQGMVDMEYVLPSSVTCDFCVLQWRYHTANSWGTDPDGRSCTGCGPQEEFYGCANVAIKPKAVQDDPSNNNSPSTTTTPTKTTRSTTPEPTKTTTTTEPAKTTTTTMESTTTTTTVTAPITTPTTTTTTEEASDEDEEEDDSNSSDSDEDQSQTTTTTTPATTTTVEDTNIEYHDDNSVEDLSPTTTTTTTASPVQKPSACKGVGAWATLPGLAQWCVDNCERGFCPPSHCKCSYN